eukprot:scaffold103723_cov63-Phaeocystis_antarctica.AAC.5
MPPTAVSSAGMARRTLSICTRSVSRIEVVESMPLIAESRFVLMLARFWPTEVYSVHEAELGSSQSQLHSPVTFDAIVASLREALLPSDVAAPMFEVSMSKTPES